METEPKVTFAFEDDEEEEWEGQEQPQREQQQEQAEPGDKGPGTRVEDDVPLDDGTRDSDMEGPSVSLFPLSNYSFGSNERGGSKVRRRLHQKMARLK
jgi:hypothetical protein